MAEPLELARKVVDVASDKQAADIVLLDLRELAVFTDFFIIASTESRRQLRALEDDVSAAMKEEGLTLHHREGSPDAGWILLDFANLVVHLFGQEERDYYQLDALWSRAPVLVKIQ